MNKKSGLTLTVVFKAQSLNYGEGIGNISELKKLNRGNGKTYTFASRQALRYDIVRLGQKLYNWNLQTVDKEKGTVQFEDKYSIADSEEMDIFGYMKTKKGKGTEEAGGSDIRSAVARLSNAISLEVYKSDMDFLTNKGLADRINEHPNLANIEQHLSFYAYTVTLDLSNLGVDDSTVLDNNVRAKRAIELLEIIKILNREIRGREENLSPLFVIGGIYDINSPFFLGRIRLTGSEKGFYLDTQILKDTIQLKIGDREIKEDTSIGMVSHTFANEEEINQIAEVPVIGVQEFFDKIEQQVREYYAE